MVRPVHRRRRHRTARAAVREQDGRAANAERTGQEGGVGEGRRRRSVRRTSQDAAGEASRRLGSGHEGPRPHGQARQPVRRPRPPRRRGVRLRVHRRPVRVRRAAVPRRPAHRGMDGHARADLQARALRPDGELPPDRDEGVLPLAGQGPAHRRQPAGAPIRRERSHGSAPRPPRTGYGRTGPAPRRGANRPGPLSPLRSRPGDAVRRRRLHGAARRRAGFPDSAIVRPGRHSPDRHRRGRLLQTPPRRRAAAAPRSSRTAAQLAAGAGRAALAGEVGALVQGREDDEGGPGAGASGVDRGSERRRGGTQAARGFVLPELPRRGRPLRRLPQPTAHIHLELGPRRRDAEGGADARPALHHHAHDGSVLPRRDARHRRRRRQPAAAARPGRRAEKRGAGAAADRDRWQRGGRPTLHRALHRRCTDG
jgi:hypothetical protein